mgnify:CR=1 FL=1|tara:strand:+ start:461 stop:1108 length:648 start_codon:yes stop_codon:yes gene_type:complete
MKKEKDISMIKPLPELKDIEGLNKYTYNFYYWGPMLFRSKLHPKDLKEVAKLCSKKSSFVNETLAGVIKHEHYVSPAKLVKIIEPYLNVFRESYKTWYGGPLDRQMVVRSAWVNFMRAGEFNPPHQHADCDYSSVFFIKIPEKIREENKKFKGRGLGPGSISFSYGEPQRYSLCYKHFLPEEGDFFMFPSTLTHYVCPFLSNEERISVSANFRFE